MVPNTAHNQNHKTQVQIKFKAPEALKRDLLDLAEERNIALSALLRLVTTEYVKRNNGT